MFLKIYNLKKFHNIIEILKKHASKSFMSHKHGACIMKNGKIHSCGVNKNIQVSSGKQHWSIHAEIDAIMNGDPNIVKGMDVFVIRVCGKDMVLRNSRPCNACINKLKNKGISRVFYSSPCSKYIICENIVCMEYLHTSYSGRCKKSDL